MIFLPVASCGVLSSHKTGPYKAIQGPFKARSPAPGAHLDRRVGGTLQDASAPGGAAECGGARLQGRDGGAQPGLRKLGSAARLGGAWRCFRGVDTVFFTGELDETKAFWSKKLEFLEVEGRILML